MQGNAQHLGKGSGLRFAERLDVIQRRDPALVGGWRSSQGPGIYSWGARWRNNHKTMKGGGTQRKDFKAMDLLLILALV